MTTKRSIVMLDADAARRTLNAFGLRCAGFSVDEAATVSEARSHIAARCPHLVLVVAARLDDEIRSFVRALRGDQFSRDMPIEVLLEQSSELDLTAAFHCGIDDCILPPLAPADFVTRVNACIELKTRLAALVQSVVGLEIDHDAGIVRHRARAVALGPTERRLLEFLLGHPERLIPRELLLFRFWSGGWGLHSRVVDVAVCRLRRALRQLGCGELLQTVSRHGYRFAPSALEARRTRRVSGVKQPDQPLESHQ